MWGSLILGQLRIEDSGLVLKKKALQMFDSAEQSYRLGREIVILFLLQERKNHSLMLGGNSLKVNQVKLASEALEI